MTFDQIRLIMNSFITSHFSYCSLVRMFHSRTLNEKINRIHERALRIVYKEYQFSFKQLLIKDNYLTIHQENLKKLVNEIFKVKNGLTSEIIQGVFDVIEKPYFL